MELSSQPKVEEKMGLPRAIGAAGFMLILLGVGIGAITKGSPWATYAALAGAGALGISIILIIVEKVTGKPIGKGNQRAA